MNFKQNLLLLLSLAGLSASADNHHLTAEQAMQRIGLPTSSARVRRAPAAKSASGNDLYYVFDQTNGGFIIASADDRARAILGQSDSGSWDATAVPPAMQGWLESMSEALQRLAESDETPARANTKAKAPAATRVEPLLGAINWGQGEPYFNECPAIGNTHSATGCAATAMAQIMRYHKYPQHGYGSNSYVSETIKFNINEDFSQTTYDWDNMKTSYPISADGSTKYYSETEASAVARLMYHLGAASNMDYNTGASGTTEGPMLKAMIDHFNYDKSLQIYYRENFTSLDWYALLQSEIDAQRPVLMNGYSISGGHAFVIDGYDTTMGNGYFHFNWGWNGMSNGYYCVDIADPGEQGTGGSLGGYSYNQNIFTSIQPDNGGKAQPNLCVSSALRYEYGQLHYQWLNRGCGSFSGQTGYVIEDGSNATFYNIENYSGIEFRSGSGSKHQSIAAPTKAGLRYYLASAPLRNSANFTAMRPMTGATAALVSVSDGKGGYTLVPETAGLANLDITSIEIEGHAYAGATINFKFDVTNNGAEEYNGALYLCITETKDGALGYEDHASDNPLGIYLRPGETNTYTLPYYGTPAVGNYIAQVLYNPRNGSGLQHITGETLNFEVVPYGSHDNAEVAPELTIKSLSVTPAEINNGDEITLTATLDNAGGNGKIKVAGLIYQQNGMNYKYVAQIDGESMSFEEGETTINISGTPDLAAGTYAIIVGDADTHLAFTSTTYAFPRNYPKFVVKEEPQTEPEPEPTPEVLSVTSLSLDAETVYANQEFTLNYTLTNGSANEFSDFVMLYLEYLDAEGKVVKTDDSLYDKNIITIAKGETKSSSIIVDEGLPEGKYRASLCCYDYEKGDNVIFEGTKLEFEVVEYKEPADMSPANLSGVNASLSAETITQGNELTLTLNANNSGGQGAITIALVAQKQISGKNYKQVGQIFCNAISFEKGANTLTFTEAINLEPGNYRFYLAYDDNDWWEPYNYDYIYLTVNAPTVEPNYDINADGQEDAEDIDTLVNDILHDTTTEAEDLNDTEAVNIGDVVTLIDYLNKK